MSLESRNARKLSALAPPLQQTGRTFVFYERKKYSYFAGCDYFRLASHPLLVRAVTMAAAKYGLNVAASRKTTGNHALYELLERKLVEFFRVRSATLVSNGYASNLVAAQALRDLFSHVLIDEKSHASLFDAAEMLQAPVSIFRHRDAGDVARLAKALTRPIVLTDGMFSHDGSVPPLADYLKALPKGGTLLVDEAHAAGILGKNGRGAVELEGIVGDRVIRTITLSKAFGSYGGAVLGTLALRQRIIERSRIFGGNTPLPLPFAAAALKGIELVTHHPEWRRRLMDNAAYVKSRLVELGLFDSKNPGPILSLAAPDKGRTGKFRDFLFKRRIYPPLIRYPGGPTAEYFRFVISSAHTREQLDRLSEALIGASQKNLL